MVNLMKSNPKLIDGKLKVAQIHLKAAVLKVVFDLFWQSFRSTSEETNWESLGD